MKIPLKRLDKIKKLGFAYPTIKILNFNKSYFLQIFCSTRDSTLLKHGIKLTKEEILAIIHWQLQIRNMMRYKIIELDSFGEKNASLVALENLKNVPFEIKRVFYIFNVPENAIRGNHANKDSEFLFIALSGSCEIQIDNGKATKNILLDTPCKALYLDKMLWKQMLHFSKDCVLLVLTNTFYNPNEYIYSYDAFLDKTGGGGQTLVMPQWWHNDAV